MRYLKKFDSINESISRDGMINVIRNILKEINSNTELDRKTMDTVVRGFADKLFPNEPDKDSFYNSIIGEIEFESRSEVVMVDGRNGGPVIAYKQDVDDDRISLSNGYFSGTAYIGGEEDEDRGVEDYSSPFHKGQVIPNDNFDDVEEMDFQYSRSIPDNIVRKNLDDYVSKNYNGKIVKVIYH